MSLFERSIPGERFMVVPQPFLDLTGDDPLAGDLFVHSMGHVAHARGLKVHRSSEFRWYVFLYCTDGCGRVRSGDVSYTLTADQYMMLPPGMSHGYRAENDDPCTLYWVVFGGRKARLYASAMGHVPAMAPLSDSSDPGLRIALFESIYAVLCGGCSLEKLQYAAIELAHFFATFIYADLLRVPVPQSGYVENIVNRMTHFMHANVERNFTLHELASEAGYSESYFCRQFVRQTGYSPIDYFIRVKINKAAVYLLKTSLTVSQIASKLGFRSPDYFSRTFRRVVGISATEFRKQDFRL